RLGVRRSRVAGGGAVVGLLVGADLLLRPRVHACLLAGASRSVVVCCPALLPYTPDLPVATGAHESAAASEPARAFATASILRRRSREDPRHDGCARRHG